MYSKSINAIEAQKYSYVQQKLAKKFNKQIFSHKNVRNNEISLKTNTIEINSLTDAVAYVLHEQERFF